MSHSRNRMGMMAIFVTAMTGLTALAWGDTEKWQNSPTISLEQARSELAAATPATTTQPSAPAGDASVDYDIMTTTRLTGDWGGLRSELDNLGIKFTPLMGFGYTQNFMGGNNTHNAHEIPGKIFWNVELDFGKMNLLPGGTFFFRAIQTWNNGIQGDTGSLGAPYFSFASSGCKELEVDKWWWRQRLLNDRIEFRLGKILTIGDLIDHNKYAGNYMTQFMNRVFYTNPTIPGVKGLGAYVIAWPTDWLYMLTLAADPDTINTHNRHGTGGFDTAFHDSCHFFGAWEFGLLPNWIGEKGNYPGNYRFGLWYHPRSQTIFKNTLGGSLASNVRTGDWGWYFNMDQMLIKENDNSGDKQGLGGFLRYGLADGDVNRIEHFWSLGAQYEGLIPERDQDVLAFAVGQSIMSRQFRREINPLADRETVYELYYAIQVTPWCVITPDVQLITNPGGNKDARDALVGGLRFKVVF